MISMSMQSYSSDDATSKKKETFDFCTKSECLQHNIPRKALYRGRMYNIKNLCYPGKKSEAVPVTLQRCGSFRKSIIIRNNKGEVIGCLNYQSKL